MHWIIGTAGHIDHGKTSLVKALTGTDTDRLKEEKERGISIDIGFASLSLPDGTRAGVIDVPGHERFIKNMLAGAHGIDLVLFTVAADDGVMPQTEEHLDIVHLLGVRYAVFVITKADLVAAARLNDVADEIRILVAGTALAEAPILPFAYPTSEGLDAIRNEIVGVLAGAGKVPPTGKFRLPVDRAFLSTGHGLIVTGTAIAGEVRPGDRVRCLPSGDVLRVRSAEVHEQTVDGASWGQRTALNLVGSTSREIARGDVIAHESITITCDRFDASIEVRPSARGGLKDHQRVRVHLGTAERLGKIIPIGSREHAIDVIPAGSRALCQIVVAEPMVAMRGDHFILRDETAQRTLAGGRVLLPATPKRRRTDALIRTRVAALASDDGVEIIEAVVADGVAMALDDGVAVSLTTLAERLNEREESVRARADASPRLHPFAADPDRLYALEATCQAVKAGIVRDVKAWHASQPLSPGLTIEDAHARVAASTGQTISPRIVRALIDELERERSVVREGSLLRIPTHKVEVAGADQVVADRVLAALNADPLAPPDVKALTEALAIDRAKLLPLLRTMEKQKHIVSVSSDLYFAAETITRVRDELTRDLADGRTLTTAAFRDRYHTSRKYAIPILEYFDRQGLTARIGEARRLKKGR